MQHVDTPSAAPAFAMLTAVLQADRQKHEHSCPDHRGVLTASTDPLSSFLILEYVEGRGL
jgi:hypothetical protein